MLSSIQTGIVGLIIGALVAGGAVWWIRGNQIDTITAQHDAALAKSALAAEKATNELSQYKLTFETRLGEAKDELQQNHDKALARIDKSISDLAGRRLQDPHADRGTGTSGNADSASGGNGPGAGGGLLSEQASEFLFNFSGTAANYLERLRTCQAWSYAVEKNYNDYAAEVNALREDLRKKGMLKED